MPYSGDPKDSLLRIIAEVETQASAYEKVAQDLARTARFTSDIARPLRSLYAITPSNALTRDQWEEEITRWQRVYDAGQSVLTARPYLQLYIATSTATTSISSSTVAAIESLVFPADEPLMMRLKAQLYHVLQQSPLVDQARSAMLRLGLDSEVGGRRSCLQILEEAQGALERPVSSEGGPISILVALRECIDRALADLLRRRPLQEPTSTAADKVRSIGRQCGLRTLDDSHFDSLAANLEALRPQLTDAKQKVMERIEISGLFYRGLGFLSALLSGIDESRLKALS